LEDLAPARQPGAGVAAVANRSVKMFKEVTEQMLAELRRRGQ
jgi:hypothetical protein